MLGTCQEVFLQHVIYFYIKVVLYRVLLMDLGNISIVWPKVAWPDLSSTQGIIAFSISICSAKVSWSGIVHKLKWLCYLTRPTEILRWKLAVHIHVDMSSQVVSTWKTYISLYGVVNVGTFTERDDALCGRKVWPCAHVTLIKAIFSWPCSGRLTSSFLNRLSLFHITLAWGTSRELSLI